MNTAVLKQHATETVKARDMLRMITGFSNILWWWFISDFMFTIRHDFFGNQHLYICTLVQDVQVVSLGDSIQYQRDLTDLTYIRILDI